MGKARTEKYLAYLSGEDVAIPEPYTKQDRYLYNLCKSGSGSVDVDKTLTQTGKAADAGEVGRLLQNVLFAKDPNK